MTPKLLILDMKAYMNIGYLYRLIIGTWLNTEKRVRRSVEIPLRKNTANYLELSYQLQQQAL